MRYVSIFSGIEAATVAWEPLGWEPLAFAEVDPFPSAVLAERFPGVPNLGDVTKVDWSPYSGRADVLVGGSPCQSFSLAGKREGLRGESGLMWEWVRAVRDVSPRWAVWENVPGCLSSGNGADFGCLLWALEDIGYHAAWRVLDAQFFGLAQRRRRVFLVASRSAGGAAAVLFERSCLLGGPQAGREAREAVAAESGPRPEGPDSGVGEVDNLTGHVSQSHRIYGVGGVSTSLTVPHGKGGDTHSPVISTFVDRCGCEGGGKGVLTQEDVASTLDCGATQRVFGIASNVIGRKDENGGHQLGVSDDGVAYTLDTLAPQAVVAVQENERNEVRITEEAGALSAGVPNKQGGWVMGGTCPNAAVEPPGDGFTVRRLVPVECERLQGFPQIIELDVSQMTSDELIACALASGDIFCDLEKGIVYGTRGPGGVKLKEPRQIGFQHPSGYIHISLHCNGEKKQVRAHRVIYIAGHGGIPDGLVIDHINNDKTDNRLCNLQALTAEENSHKAHEDGLYVSGEDNPATKIDAEMRSQVVWGYVTGGGTYREMAEKYGISKTRVFQLVKESGWTDIPGATDTKRYKSLGNSMPVPAMRWTAERIEMVDEMLQEDEPRFRKGARAQLGVALNALQEAEEALAFPDPDLSERIGHAKNIAASAKEVLEERL